MNNSIQGKLERRPKERQIADYYIRLIQIGRIKDGDQLPGRGEISNVFSVGAMVAQRALEIMRGEGYAVTIPRKATYASLPGATTPPAC